MTHLSVAALDSAGCSCECRVPSSHRRCCDCTASLAPRLQNISTLDSTKLHCRYTVYMFDLCQQISYDKLTINRKIFSKFSPRMFHCSGCCGFAAVGPAARRYRSIAARPAGQRSAAAADAGSAAWSADVGSLTQACCK